MWYSLQIMEFPRHKQRFHLRSSQFNQIDHRKRKSNAIDQYRLHKIEPFNEIDGKDAIGDEMDAPEGGAGGKVGEEKEIGKEGLKKKILNEGDHWDTPLMAMKLKHSDSILQFTMLEVYSMELDLIQASIGSCHLSSSSGLMDLGRTGGTHQVVMNMLCHQTPPFTTFEKKTYYFNGYSTCSREEVEVRSPRLPICLTIRTWDSLPILLASSYSFWLSLIIL
ncbi:unnamed protein product [Lactuca virosa]|uniref:Uncharacterized protein n=1 Tax=Lactuca virosa TaxID=75947 RepID=A0AAU9N1V5_9ASTR|nr:unnamed protein product [Lactuca virosa]